MARVAALVLFALLTLPLALLAQDAAAPAAEAAPSIDWLAAGEHLIAILSLVVIPALIRWGGRWATVGRVAIKGIEAYQAARPSSPIKQAVAAEAERQGVSVVVDKAVQKVTG